MTLVAGTKLGPYEIIAPLGAGVALFQTHTRQPISAMDLFWYDLTVDGQKSLINARVDEPSSAPLSIILNWASEIEK